MFLSVCSELQRMIALLSPVTSPGSGLVFAWNVLARGIAALETTEDDLQTVTLQELPLRSNANESPNHTTSAVGGVASVVLFVATFLLELTSGTSSAKRAATAPPHNDDELRSVLLSAYRRVFASRHPWIVQRTVADAIGAATPSRSAFFAALRAGNERIVRTDRILEGTLRTCGLQLQVNDLFFRSCWCGSGDDRLSLLVWLVGCLVDRSCTLSSSSAVGTTNERTR